MLLYALSLQESSAISERTKRAEPEASVVVACGHQDIPHLASIIGALIRSGQPRFLVCIEHLVEGDTLALICQTKHLSVAPKTLLIFNYSDSRFSREMMEVYRDGILGISSAEHDTVLQTLKLVLSGGTYRDSAVSKGSGSKAGFSVPQRDYKLTAREQQVLQLIVQGYSNREISEKLYLGLSTIKTHVGQVLDKLGARDRTQAAIQAIVLELVPWPSAGQGGVVEGVHPYPVNRERTMVLHPGIIMARWPRPERMP